MVKCIDTTHHMIQFARFLQKERPAARLKKASEVLVGQYGVSRLNLN